MQKRAYGSAIQSKRLPDSVSVIGLGCSSFSTFFWSESTNGAEVRLDVKSISRDNPHVVEWVRTIQYAIGEGITLLDTAPWYGHGVSETVVGFAIEDLISSSNDFDRGQIVINTKVGRYEADPKNQFDFSRDAVLLSVDRSLDRLRCGYIDVLQLHDPEFAPSLDQLLNETIPALLECRNSGKCRALGMTGYPLEIQYQILQASFERFGNDCWDQALTYGHFNLHDRSLVSRLMPPTNSSFFDYCQQNRLAVLAA
jgi:aryl-alcohol dehydrogenase-like predicted oxidoreductase